LRLDVREREQVEDFLREIYIQNLALDLLVLDELQLWG